MDSPQKMMSPASEEFQRNLEVEEETKEHTKQHDEVGSETVTEYSDVEELEMIDRVKLTLLPLPLY
jgi:hypothetical protein